MRFRLLSRDPFTDIGRTIPEFRSVGLAERRSFTVSLSTRRTFLRSMAKPPDSCSSTPRSMSTCSPVIRPLTNNTTRLSALTTRSILQLICGRSILLFPLASRSGLRRTGSVEHVCRAQISTQGLTPQQPHWFSKSPRRLFHGRTLRAMS